MHASPAFHGRLLAPSARFISGCHRSRSWCTIPHARVHRCASSQPAKKMQKGGLMQPESGAGRVRERLHRRRLCRIVCCASLNSSHTVTAYESDILPVCHTTLCAKSAWRSLPCCCVSSCAASAPATSVPGQRARGAQIAVGTGSLAPSMSGGARFVGRPAGRPL